MEGRLYLYDGASPSRRRLGNRLRRQQLARNLPAQRQSQLLYVLVHERGALGSGTRDAPARAGAGRDGPIALAAANGRVEGVDAVGLYHGALRYLCVCVPEQ